ncbi:MAG: lysylphosphatidylglycerol synthase transmembrane domain-containing protein [Chloroflexota bacterium]
MQARLFAVLRSLVSLALLGLLSWKLGVAQLWSVLSQADALWLAVGAALVVLALLVSALKWQLLLGAHGLSVPYPALFSSYLIGLFFNNFLPSNIGGDVLRVHDVAKRTGHASAVAASVIAERLLAGLALALTAAGALLFSARYTAQVGPSVGLALLVFAGLIGLTVSPGVRAWLARVLPAGRAQLVARVTGQMGDALRKRDAVVAVLALSFAFQAVVVLVAWTGFAAIGQPVSLAACFVFIPIISAVQLVPVSLNGLGVREGAYVLFFGGIGVGELNAAAASLLFGLLVAGVSLAGGALFAARR